MKQWGPPIETLKLNEWIIHFSNYPLHSFQIYDIPFEQAIEL